MKTNANTNTNTSPNPYYPGLRWLASAVCHDVCLSVDFIAMEMDICRDRHYGCRYYDFDY